MRIFTGLLLAALLGACSQGAGGGPEAAPANCGLLTPKPSADPEQIPASLRLGGAAEVATTELREGRLLAAMNVRMTVDESLAAYKEALGESGLEILQEDNEGFEAELYVKDGKELGSVVIRRSLCEDAVVVYLNLVAPRQRSS